MEGKDSLEQRLEVLETKISYQDHLIEQLNDVVVSQSNALDSLGIELARLQEFIKGVLSEER